MIPRSSGATGAHSLRNRNTLWGLFQRPVDRATEHQRSQRVQIESRPGGDAEVATATTQSPQQLGFVIGIRTQLVSFGRDQINGEEVVDGQPVTSQQMSEPAKQRQAADADSADRTSGGRQPVPLSRKIKVSPGRSSRRVGTPAARIHPNALQERQIDHETGIAHRMAGNTMSAPPH
jgi:hypothetical protein